MIHQAKEYARLITDAFIAGNDDYILELHAELVTDQDLYLDTWSQLPSAMRRSIKELVDRDQ